MEFEFNEALKLRNELYIQNLQNKNLIIDIDRNQNFMKNMKIQKMMQSIKLHVALWYEMSENTGS